MKILLLVAILLSAMSCKNKMDVKNYKSSKMEYDKVLMKCEITDACMAPPPPNVAMEQSNTDNKLIKRGNLTIAAKDIEATKKQIYGFVKSCKGYVANEYLENRDEESFYQISLNIRADFYDNFLHLLDSSKLTIVARSFSVDDVTMQYVDNATRLENKKKLEKRYLELLSKTKDVKDMLEIEEKLEGIRTDIEVRENQLKILDRQIAYSVFNIRIEKQTLTITKEQKNRYAYHLQRGLSKGWDVLKNFGVLLVSIWPLYILAGFVSVIFKNIRKKKKA